MAENNNQLNNFVKSTDYRDICWFIDHVDNQDIRNSCCEMLGYSIGIDIIDTIDKIKVKSVIMGTQGEFRVISDIAKNKRVAECIICRK